MSDAVKAILAKNRDLLSPAEAATILKVDPQWLRLMARQRPERLPFPVLVVGTHVKIPTRPLLKYLGIAPAEEKASASSDPYYATRGEG